VGARFEANGLRNRGVDEQGKQLETVGCKGKTLLTGEKLEKQLLCLGRSLTEKDLLGTTRCRSRVWDHQAETRVTNWIPRTYKITNL